MRKAFSFYRSYYETYKLLDDKTKVQIMDALLERQFNGTEPQLEGISQIIWGSWKFLVDQQVKGYEDKTKTKIGEKRDPIEPPTEGGKEGGYQPPYQQEQEQEQEQVKEKEKVSNNNRTNNGKIIEQIIFPNNYNRSSIRSSTEISYNHIQDTFTDEEQKQALKELQEVAKKKWGIEL